MIKDKNIRVTTAAHAFLSKRAWKKRQKIKQVVDDLCFPKGIPIKGSVS